ncbi:sensor histidine kinase [Tuwongella immobilis]|uniref:histidine kinase n=1 Tax=Tuwongella immobilis TaxID=692036 RepID=A0A6C2YLM0_9BACT|nr:ATP-binding protein [Tuwongella immobilis]VIP02470.1 histidine kinase : Histidine kinase OS=Planctomyces limnophilus (strain ATCC 43296 / DSM 3776 / IFAM 1008 / 290) GN=Plim_3849 PE=4 SV=1: HisKA: HATPase_c [Tuwongella immobilis]VTS01496.1 histidine kinase : Histidine kinase OS=Planctomyces limnophilus (strain ATCC 43296 / DSM 3776 / IFAM 1008 / 290) GN=Plim_3849 PE=4 SV=1: HisKA: HATPase_c [Tuwongella immobilis]
MRTLSPPLPAWELDAEAIAVKIRWFGLLVGYLYVNIAAPLSVRWILNAILSLGAIFTVLDTFYSLRGRVFLGRYPIVISILEALFIGLLCYFDSGLDSPFRYYYLLSLICCAIRYSARLTAITCALDCLSYWILYTTLPPERGNAFALFLMLIVLVWVTWASSSMSRLIKRIGENLIELNSALRKNQAELEARIQASARELQETQAQMWHQEKMAAFGLLAAGIAHEVGNPLTSISTVVQLLEKRDIDEYTRDRLGLVSGQLHRIQGTLRELMNFSRPASKQRTRIAIADIIHEAMKIAKYYHGTNSRIITAEIPEKLPLLVGVRDQLVQVFLNLLLNAIDATHKGGRIDVRAKREGDWLMVTVKDNGAGISPENQIRLFQPYYTTKEHGTGLGLFVTQKMITEHAGTVEFESIPGVGTEFQVRLPLPQLAEPFPTPGA